MDTLGNEVGHERREGDPPQDAIVRRAGDARRAGNMEEAKKVPVPKVIAKLYYGIEPSLAPGETMQDWEDKFMEMAFDELLREEKDENG